MSRLTIEPAKDGGINVYAHGVYEASSVLAGQARRSFEAYFKTREEAVAAYPNAEVLDYSTAPVRFGDESLEDLSGLPSTPPAWFDPMAAGERWDSDY